jgi:hypothetical protein
MNLPAKNAGKQSMATCQALQKSKGRGIISGEGGMIVWWSFGAGVHVGPHSRGPGDVAVIPAGAEHTAELQRSFLRHPGLAHAAMFVWDSFRLDATKQPLPFYCQEISNVYRMRAPNRRNGVRRFCSAGR